MTYVEVKSYSTIISIRHKCTATYWISGSNTSVASGILWIHFQLFWNIDSSIDHASTSNMTSILDDNVFWYTSWNVMKNCSAEKFLWITKWDELRKSPMSIKWKGRKWDSSKPSFWNIRLTFYHGALLTGGNWQKWKRVFLTCPCHEIYRDEAVVLKSCKYTWKITIFVKMWNLGQYRENLMFCE